MYLNQDETVMTVAQVHPNSESMEFHMKVAGPVFPQFQELLELQAVDVYGTPSPTLLEQLRHKAEMLGNAPLAVHDRQAGFSRFLTRQAS